MRDVGRITLPNVRRLGPDHNSNWVRLGLERMGRASRALADNYRTEGALFGTRLSVRHGASALYCGMIPLPLHDNA
jgi:hypothetical protein